MMLIAKALIWMGDCCASMGSSTSIEKPDAVITLELTN
jgi:hypothetical protein